MQEIIKSISEFNKNIFINSKEFDNSAMIEIKKSSYFLSIQKDFWNYIKTREELSFDYLRDVYASNSDDKFSITYSFYSLVNNKKLYIKITDVEDDDSLMSIKDLWAGSVCYEREIWELFGVKFDIFENLNFEDRMLLPSECKNFPLRKKQMQGENL